MNASRHLVSALFVLVLAPIGSGQNQQWMRQFGTILSDAARATAPDGSDGVYMSGFTDGSLGGPSAGARDAWLARYDGEGNQLWIRQFGTGTEESAQAVASDGSGGVYVSGYTYGSLGGPNAGSQDAWLAHYDGAGNQLWLRQLGTNDADSATAAAPDGTGGVYLSGDTRGSLGGPSAGDQDVWLAHYDGAGNQLWIRQLGTAGVDGALATAPDDSGGFYVGGMSTCDLGGPSGPCVVNLDAWLARYDGAGNQLWISQLASISPELAYGAAPDGAGGVFLTGVTQGSLGGPINGHADAWLARYDGAGNQRWIRQFGTSSAESAHSAAPDGAGGVFVTGTTTGSLGGPNAGLEDAWLARYDGAGNQLWSRQFGTGTLDYSLAAAPDGSGGAFVSGYTFGGLGGSNAGASDAWLTRYTSDLGESYCGPAIPNSSALPGLIEATGNTQTSTNDVTLTASQLPPGQFGYFLAGQTQGLLDPPGSQGVLCLSGNIGRYSSSVDIIQGPSGSLQLDLTAIPVNPPQAVLPGDTWNFQCWFRDMNPGSTSNFTDAVSVTFQ